MKEIVNFVTRVISVSKYTLNGAHSIVSIFKNKFAYKTFQIYYEYLQMAAKMALAKMNYTKSYLNMQSKSPGYVLKNKCSIKTS